MNPEKYAQYVKTIGDMPYNGQILAASAVSCSNQVFYANNLSSVLSDTMDLSVRYVTADQFHEMVTGGEYSAYFEPKTLYIISSDEINAYGTRIRKVADPIDDDDAANKRYVDEQTANVLPEGMAMLSDLNGMAMLSAENEFQENQIFNGGVELHTDLNIIDTNYV